MRCKLVTGLTIALVMVMATIAAADAVKGQLMIVPRGSLGLPVGDYPITGRTWSYLKDDVKVGYAFGVLVDRMVTSHVSFGAQVDYNFHSIRGTQWAERQPPAANVEPNFTWKVLQFSGHVRYHVGPQKPVSLFGQFGAGAYVNKFSPNVIRHGSNGISVEVPLSESRTRLGVNAGPGIIMRLGPSSRFMLEAILHNVFTPNQNMRYLNISAGLVFSIMPE